MLTIITCSVFLKNFRPIYWISTIIGSMMYHWYIVTSVKNLYYYKLSMWSHATNTVLGTFRELSLHICFSWLPFINLLNQDKNWFCEIPLLIVLGTIFLSLLILWPWVRYPVWYSCEIISTYAAVLTSLVSLFILMASH